MVYASSVTLHGAASDTFTHTHFFCLDFRAGNKTSTPLSKEIVSVSRRPVLRRALDRTRPDTLADRKPLVCKRELGWAMYLRSRHVLYCAKYHVGQFAQPNRMLSPKKGL